MMRKVTLGEQTSSLELLALSPDGTVRLRVDGVEREASAIEVMPGVWSVLLDGRSFEARVISANGEVVVEIAGRRYPVTVEDPRRNRPKGQAGAGEGRLSLTAPMPGKVVRVLASEGDEIAAGAGVAVIEAMKMQNEIRTPRAGRVTSLPVREGDTLAAGAVVAVVE
jgi:biotin carboxyl carrier protein